MNSTTAQFQVLFWFFILVIGFLVYVYYQLRKQRHHIEPFELKRAIANPIIAPTGHVEWESQGTFNPAAVVDDEGAVHLIYRAIGSDGISRFGYAKSSDGISIDEKVPYPVYQTSYVGTEKIETKKFNPAMYTSGGGWCGTEDPRAVVIDDRVYVTYVSFGGWHSLRIALTSISLEDLKKKRWNWKKPILISPVGEPHKNWLLFPEKINGKYVMLHGIAPEIYVEYLDDLTYPFEIKSPRKQGPQKGRADFWDSRLRGAGAPPIKTRLGWLVLYHAEDDSDPGKYKLGALILDLQDPTKILYRSHEPLLTPCMHYENDYKPGIVYGSGAVVKDGMLNVYYGGGDKHVCVAQTKLDTLLDWLVQNGTV